MKALSDKFQAHVCPPPSPRDAVMAKVFFNAETQRTQSSAEEGERFRFSASLCDLSGLGVEPSRPATGLELGTWSFFGARDFGIGALPVV